MDYNRFKMLMNGVVRQSQKAMISPEARERQRVERENSGTARLLRGGGMYPYDNYRQRARYGRQHAKALAKAEAKRIHELAMKQDLSE